VRNVEDGKVVGVGNPAARTLRADVAKRECQPQGRSSTPGGAGRTRDGRTLKRREAYERMNPFAQVSGGRQPVGTASSDGNVEGKAGVDEPMSPLAGCLQHSEEQRTS